MKQYIHPQIVVRHIEIRTKFLVGSDPTINTNNTSDDMETKEIGNDDYGHSIW